MSALENVVFEAFKIHRRKSIGVLFENVRYKKSFFHGKTVKIKKNVNKPKF